MLLNTLLLLIGLAVAFGYPIGHSHSRFHRRGGRCISWQDSNIETRLPNEVTAAREASNQEIVDSAVVEISIHDDSTDDEPQSLSGDMNIKFLGTDVPPSPKQTANLSTVLLEERSSPNKPASASFPLCYSWESLADQYVPLCPASLWSLSTFQTHTAIEKRRGGGGRGGRGGSGYHGWGGGDSAAAALAEDRAELCVKVGVSLLVVGVTHLFL